MSIILYLYLFLCFFLILLLLLLLVAFSILLERKILGSIQRRRGPNVTGFIGLLQPIADAVKLIIKETIIPALSNKIIFLLAPIATLFLSMLHWAIIPFNIYWVISDLNLGLLYFFAISSLGTYGIIMAGWSSNSKYAFLGALRSAAQIIAYEVSIGLILISIISVSKTINFTNIILMQKNYNIWYIFPFFFFFFFIFNFFFSGNK